MARKPSEGPGIHEAGAQYSSVLAVLTLQEINLEQFFHLVGTIRNHFPFNNVDFLSTMGRYAYLAHLW